ncbi:sensor histidine kinase [Pseudonocardia acaciae]|uniref:sensor histidine kinase n=1 Tax=Pseudonocardia acaciae TaxID=551276 RepID=UPI00048F2A7F|nr:histidine kinase [Pseudonocardia acaciae]
MAAWASVSRVARPGIVDAAVAVALFVLPVVVVRPARYPDMATLPHAVAAALVCAAIAARRRWPLPMLALGTAAGVAATVAAHGRTPYPQIIALIAYTVATRVDRKVAWAWVGGCAGLVVATEAIVTADRLTMEVVQPVAWIGMGAAIGGTLRIRRAYVAEVEERARRAEQTRDEVAARHVAEERLAIARELHDVVAHRIAVINVQAGVAGHLVRTRPDEAAEAIAHIRASGRAVLGELSAMLGVLRDTGDAPTRPTPRLEQLDELIESFTAAGLTVELSVHGSPGPLSPALDLAAYRIIQESLTNVHKHGRRRHASVRLEHRDDALSLEIRNADRHTADGRRGGHGIIGMRERAASVGGSLRAEPEPGPDGGFLVTATLPRSEG